MSEKAERALIVMPSDPESKAQMEQLLAHLTGENRRALAAAEARVAALEAGINALADEAAFVVALNNYVVSAEALRALTEKAGGE